MFARNELETESQGEKLGLSIKAGIVIWINGEMGAGKTAFVRGLARGLGVTDRVTSPTYSLVQEYNGRLPLFHFDLYRLTGMDALLDIGWEDYLERGGVCAVEWGERAGIALEGITVRIKIHGEGRLIEIDNIGY